MATSGKACPEPPAFKIQIMVRVPHDSVPPLVEAAKESWRTCSCACREGNRIYFGTTAADEESAFVLFSEAFCSDKQHLEHAEGFAESLLAKVRVELQVQPAFALSKAQGPDERKGIFEQYGSTTEDKHLKDCERLWYGPRIQVLQPGSGQHVKESSPFPLWDGDEEKEWDTGLRFKSPAGTRALHLRMREMRLESGMEAPNKRQRVG